MFIKDGILYRSDILDIPGTAHGFSSREGGVSTLSHLATFNLTKGLGDPDENVTENIGIFASALSSGVYSGESTVTAHQIHSSRIRIIGRENCGEGFSKKTGEDCDGFVTACRGVIPIVRTADCVPILLAGIGSGGIPVIGAVHAGWRGTVLKIAESAVVVMSSFGCRPEEIKAAIGPHIMECCYEVGEDFMQSVTEKTSVKFALRYIKAKDGRLFADLTGMNLEILKDAGLEPRNIDVSDICTCCSVGDKSFFSHRASHGKRGTQGAGIVIL